MEKNIKTKKIIFISIFIFLIIILLYFIFNYNNTERKETNDVKAVNNNSVKVNNTSENNIENSENIENSTTSSQDMNDNVTIEQQNEIEAYWNNYKNPNHWSENTKKYTLAYALKEDKYDNKDDYITQTEEIINSKISNGNKGIFITSSSRLNIGNALKAEGLDIFYIDDSGMLKYKISEYTLKTPLEEFLISVIDNSEKLYIIDISFAYIDEDNGTKPVSIPIEINYLGFNINDNQELFVYNMYNFNFEVFIEGLQELTNRKIETK